MQEQIVRAIATEIVRGQLLGNWQFYALLVALGLVSGFVASLIGGYAKRRGETYATKADMHEVLDQLRRTTEVAEEVRLSISHADWLAREWKTLRRVKLEELLEQAHATEHWLERERGIWLFQHEEKSAPCPADKVVQLSTLYFPELGREVEALVNAERAAYSWIMETAGQMHQAGADAAARQAVWDAALPQWREHYPAVLRALANIRAAAPNVLQEIRGA